MTVTTVESDGCGKRPRARARNAPHNALIHSHEMVASTNAYLKRQFSAARNPAHLRATQLLCRVTLIGIADMHLSEQYCVETNAKKSTRIHHVIAVWNLGGPAIGLVTWVRSDLELMSQKPCLLI
jgi:hypothetical protein